MIQDRKLSPAEIDAQLKAMAADPDYETKKLDFLDTLDDATLESYAKYTTQTLGRKPEVGQASQIPNRKFAIASEIRSPGTELVKAGPSDLQVMPERDLERLAAIKGAEPVPTESKGWLDNNFGMTLRAAGKGAAALPGLVADYTLLPLVDSMTGEGVSNVGTQGLLDSAFDQAGVKAPTTEGERVYSDIVGGIAGVGPGMLAMKGAGKLLGIAGEKTLAGRAGGWLGANATAQPGLQVASAGLGGGAAGSVREGGGNSIEQLAAALAAGSVPQMLSAGRGAATRGLMRGSDPTPMRNVIQEFEAAGTTPSVGQATGGQKAQSWESFLSKQFGTSGQMRAFGREQDHGMRDKITELVDGLEASARPKQVGDEVYRQVDELFKPEARKVVSEGYQDFDKLFPPESPTLVSAFEEFLKNKATSMPEIKNLASNDVIDPSATNWQSVLQDLGKDLKATGSLPFAGVKELRSKLGNQLSDTIFDTKVPVSEIRGAYRALSQDMMTAAKKAGNGADIQLTEASKRAEELFDHMDLIRGVLDRKGGGEKIFQGLTTNLKEGATVLEGVYDAIPEAGARKMLSSAIITRMVRKNPGSNKVDLENFFKNYNAISPEARKQIFNSISPEYAKNFEQIHNAVDRIKQQREDFGLSTKAQEGGRGFQMVIWPLLAGSSGAFAANQSGLATAAGAGAAVGTALLGAKMSASWMTNPRVVKWLAETTKVPPSQIPQMIGQLEQQGRRDSDTDLIAFSQYLQQQIKEGKK